MEKTTTLSCAVVNPEFRNMLNKLAKYLNSNITTSISLYNACWQQVRQFFMNQSCTALFSGSLLRGVTGLNVTEKMRVKQCLQ